MAASRLIGFYSYKGGVGRSLALAHCAVELARRGRKVLIVDLDLEAPGQHCTNLFDIQIGAASQPLRGFVELARGYGERMVQGLPDLQQFLLLSTIEFGRGRVFLLPAGNVADEEEYRRSLANFDWNEALSQGSDFGLLAHLKSECRRLGFDDVLLDARTGHADPFYVVALELADVLVVVTGYNRQNLLGTQAKLDELALFPAARQPGKVILVYAPRPPIDDLGYWKTHVQPIAPRLAPPLLELPYQAALALSEDLLNLQGESEGDYVAAVRRLVEAIDVQTPPAPAVAPRLVNPFSVIRADYASNKELIKFFVDPGDAITRAMSDFMPLMIYGNRGTGKTTIAKHHSYETVLDNLSRPATPEDLPQRIGLYLRLDIDLLNSFNVRVEELRPEFNRLFANFFDIYVVRKALSALAAFGGIDAWCDERRLFMRLLREFGENEFVTLTPDHFGFLAYIEDHFSKLRRFLNNPGQVQAPVKIQGNILMKLLVESLLESPDNRFGDRWFAMLVDEVEHFEDYQQAVLNSRIKQIKQSDRVTYRYFLRHEGLRTRKTIVAEDQTIQESHDFRTLKLDEGLQAEQFQKHMADVASKQLELQPQVGPVPLGVAQRSVEQLFASLTPEQEAVRLVAASRRNDPLPEWLNKHHGQRLTPQFREWFDAEPAILRRVVAIFLLTQGKPADDIAREFSCWSQRAADWYHNYHRAGLYWLCRRYSAEKTYAGIEQLYVLSGQNVRYFLEYCRAIVDQWIASAPQDDALVLPIPVDVQDRAIRARASFYIDDLRGKPRYADQMLNLVKRLGAIFSAAHNSSRQSQFEMNHFSIVDFNPKAEEELAKAVRECRMENVLLRRPGNKQKSLSDDRLDDWVLHPCFAPYFNISPRRKKKLEWLTSSHLKVLFDGTTGAFGELLKLAERKFEAKSEDSGAADDDDTSGTQIGLDFDRDAASPAE